MADPILAALGALLVFAVGAVTLAFQTLFFVILGDPRAGAAYQPALLPPFWRAISSALPLAGVAPHRDERCGHAAQNWTI